MEGEEVVTILAVFCACRSVLSSQFLFEAIGLLLLTLCVLFGGVQIDSRKLENFQARRGAATGILLGLLTWPLVFISRLQMEGRLLDRQFFWISILCSITLLIFMCSPRYNYIYLWKLFFMLVSLSMCILLAWLTGSQIIFLLPLSAFGSVVLFRGIFQEFPGSATLGEASLIASGLSMYTGNIIFKFLHEQNTVPKDSLDALIQISVLGIGLMPWIYKAFLRITNSARRISVVASVCFIVTVFAPKWFWLLTGVRQHPIVWVLNFMMEEPLQRFGLCIFWVFILSVVPYLYHAAERGRTPQILLRKIYHVLAVVMFVPALFIQPDFLRLAFAVALVVFSVAEMIRIWQVPTLGSKVKDFMKPFTDSRDSEKLIISHFSLLLGCAIPAWLHAHTEKHPLAPFAGILSIGVGDTMASFIGYNFGSRRLGSTTKKTFEGTLAGFTSMVLACCLIVSFVPSCSISSQLPSVLMASIFGGLVEAYTSQLDNIFVPLVCYCFLCL